MKKFIPLILALLLPGVLFGAPVTKTVKLDGSGDYLTIQEAIDAVADGDTILVYPGNYSGPGNRDISFKGKNITVQSTFFASPADLAAIAGTVIDSGGTSAENHFGFTFKNGEDSHAVLRGFTIQNGYSAFGAGVRCLYSNTLGRGAGPTISNCIFQKNTAVNLGAAVTAYKLCSPTIFNCVFIENTVGSAGGGGAVAAFDGSNIQITNSLFGGNVANRGGAVYVQAISTVTLTNCTVAYNKVTGYGGGAAAYDHSTINTVNTIIWGNTAGINGDALSAEVTSGLDTQYSDFPDISKTVYLAASSFIQSQNLHLDPLFADANGPDDDIDTWKGNDLRLSALSPCIDKGDPGRDYTGQKDLDNYPRVIHARVDMGAYEKPFGTLTVLFDPSTITAQIGLDKGPLGPAPAGLQIPTGNHEVLFGPVTDYSDPTPNPKIVNVVEDPSITDPTQAPVVTEVTGTYTKLQAVLSVATAPVSGTVIVDGVPWGMAPQSKLIDVGDHTVTFGPVADYETPGPQTVTVKAGVPQPVVMGTYTHDTGTISVDTIPVKGEVLVDGVPKGTAPVAGISLETGSHVVTFGVVDGYGKPAGIPVNVVKGANPPLTGAYIPLPSDTGTLTVDTTGTKGLIYLNGRILGYAPQSINLALGQYTVSFGDVAGYDKPADQPAVIGKDQTTQITGNYVLQTGTLTVSTTPVLGEVLVNGVPWGTSPQAKLVPVGDYTVTFGDVTGYTTPAAQTVTVAKNDQKTVNGAYIPPSTVPTGTLTVGTTPVLGEVFVDGQSWGSAPQSNSLPTGTHKITFGEMPGYIGPGDQDVSIVKDQAATITGTYVQLSPTKYNLTVNTEGQGTVQPTTGEYDMDTQLSLLAAPDVYWVFDHWEGDLTGTDNPATLTMTGNKTVKAVFRQATPEINSFGDWLRVLCLPFAGFTVAGIFLGGSLLGRKSY